MFFFQTKPVGLKNRPCIFFQPAKNRMKAGTWVWHLYALALSSGPYISPTHLLTADSRPQQTCFLCLTWLEKGYWPLRQCEWLGLGKNIENKTNINYIWNLLFFFTPKIFYFIQSAIKMFSQWFHLFWCSYILAAFSFKQKILWICASNSRHFGAAGRIKQREGRDLQKNKIKLKPQLLKELRLWNNNKNIFLYY